jgi:hypothetical protein
VAAVWSRLTAWQTETFEHHCDRYYFSNRAHDELRSAFSVSDFREYH